MNVVAFCAIFCVTTARLNCKNRCLLMRKPKVDLEMAQFQADLLQSVREMKAGTFARSMQVPVTGALQARAKMDLSQSQFAKLLAVSVHTLQEWE
jgi:hypothetical protein